MSTNVRLHEMDMKARLSTLWVFMLLNYLYCDVLGLFDPTVARDLTQDALLAASVLMEIPIGMVLLSRLSTQRPNRFANIVAAAVMAIVQFATLFAGPITVSYVFFSTIEIATLLAILWSAWQWSENGPRALGAAGLPGD